MKIYCNMELCRFNEALHNECLNDKRHENCPYYKMVTEKRNKELEEKRRDKWMLFLLCSLALLLLLAAVYIWKNQSSLYKKYSVVEPESEEVFVEETVDISEEPIVEEPVEVASVEPEVGYVRFDVPLEQDLQNHIFMLCAERDLDPAIVFAMIDQESKFNADIVGDGGNSFGLMQIQPRWHSDRMVKLGCTDLLDPYQNVTVGVDFLAELVSDGKSIEWALMAYNGGPAYANRKTSAGVLSEYAASVLRKSSELNYA